MSIKSEYENGLLGHSYFTVVCTMVCGGIGSSTWSTSCPTSFSDLGVCRAHLFSLLWLNCTGFFPLDMSFSIADGLSLAQPWVCLGSDKWKIQAASQRRYHNPATKPKYIPIFASALSQIPHVPVYEPKRTGVC